jgi:hypothetical protein
MTGCREGIEVESELRRWRFRSEVGGIGPGSPPAFSKNFFCDIWGLDPTLYFCFCPDSFLFYIWILSESLSRTLIVVIYDSFLAILNCFHSVRL